MKFRDRVTLDVTNFHPGTVIVAGGCNDDAYSASEIQSEASAVFTAILSANPGVRLIVIGPWSNSGHPPAARISNDAAIGAAARAAGALFVSPIEDHWITGTGKTSSHAGDGNADIYIGPDNHPSPAGHLYLGQMLASALSLAGEESPTGPIGSVRPTGGATGVGARASEPSAPVATGSPGRLTQAPSPSRSTDSNIAHGSTSSNDRNDAPPLVVLALGGLVAVVLGDLAVVALTKRRRGG